MQEFVEKKFSADGKFFHSILQLSLFLDKRKINLFIVDVAPPFADAPEPLQPLNQYLSDSTQSLIDMLLMAFQKELEHFRFEESSLTRHFKKLSKDPLLMPLFTISGKDDCKDETKKLLHVTSQ